MGAGTLLPCSAAWGSDRAATMNESTPVMRVRLGFHLALASIFFPVPGLNVVVVTLLAMMAQKHVRDPEARPWVFRLFGLAALDLLVAFSFSQLPETLLEAPPVDPGAYFDLEWDEREEPGLRIASVGEGSAAEESGIVKDDVLTAVDQSVIDTVDDVGRVIGQNPRRTTHDLDLVRDERSIRVRLAPDPSRPRGGPDGERPRQGFFELIERTDPESAEDRPGADDDSSTVPAETVESPGDSADGPGAPARPYDIGIEDVLASLVDQLPVLGLLAILGLLGRRRGPPVTAVWCGIGAALFAGWCFAILTEWSLIRHFGGLTPAATLFGISAQQAAQFVIGAIVYLRMGHRLQMPGDGRPRAEVAPVIFLGVFYLSLFFVRVGVVVVYLQDALRRFLPTQIDPIENIFALGLDSAGLNLLFLNAVILAPITEEILFRGLLFPALCLWIPPGWALFGSSALFALMHSYYGIGILMVFMYGMVLGWARWVSGGMRAPILLHSGINGVTMILMTMGQGMV